MLDPPDESEGLIQAPSAIPIERFDANLGQEVFTTTVDKARLCLNETLHSLELRDAWKAPLAILATLGAVLPTTGFRDFLGLSKDTWQASVLLAALASAMWLVRSLWNRPKARSVDQVIEDLRTKTRRTGQH